MKNKGLIFSLISVFLLATVAFAFFFPDDVEGNVLRQHDIMQGIANGEEARAFQEETGTPTRWTDALFGGMPTFQIAPSYTANSMLSWIQKIYTLFLPSPANLLFGMMLGMFILCLCMKMRWKLALFASIAWGFSSYFIIIIGAGHIWKFLALSYIPPTIGGLFLLYRGKWLGGAALTSLFGALQLQSNHPQMTYYFLFVIFFLVLAWLWIAIKEKNIRQWMCATLIAIIAGCAAVGANSASLYNSMMYSKETVRGRSTDLSVKSNGNPAAEGMDRNAITAWSYGLDETFTLLIPNVKGGATIRPEAGENRPLSLAQTPKASELNLSPEEMQVLDSYFYQYFGDQPMTNGPVYVGAFILLLAILAMFTVSGRTETPVKWALFASSILSIMLAWGHNFPALTNFFIDNFPGYNKFRAVASILVIVEFCIPLLAAMAVRQMVGQKDYFTSNKWTIITVFGLGAAVCFLGWVAPSVFGSPMSLQEREMLSSQGILGDPAWAPLLGAVSETRLSLVSADSLRSLIFILLGCGLTFMQARGMFRRNWLFIGSLTAVMLIDLFSVNKRYVSSDSFTAPVESEQQFEMTDADRQILADKSHYRVLDVDGFGSARSSYFHKTVGGYHAAKLTRYNDLIDRQISKNNPGVINMLNAKYIISQGQAILNPDALGPAWIVEKTIYADSPDSEMAALDTLDTRRFAVADRKFEKILGNNGKNPADTLFLTSYAPNRLVYRSKTAAPTTAIFSEVYFPWGWTATIDGKETEIGRADYVLRALNLPAGTHEIVFTFDPESLKTTNAIGVASVIVIYAICAAACVFLFLNCRRRKNPDC